MCKQARRHALIPALLAAAALGGFAPTRAAGQTLLELRERRGRLEALYRAAQRTAARAESLRVASLDTIRQGVIAVLAAPRVTPVVREAVTVVWPLMDRTYGDAAAPAAAGRPGRQGGGDDWLVLHDSALALTTATNTILRHVERQLSPPPGHPFNVWHGASPIAPHSAQETSREMKDAYVELVTAPSPPARDCLLGDLARCRVALTLTSVTDRAAEWYDAAGRRAVVARLLRDREVGGYRQWANECVDARSDAACRELLRALGPAVIPAPLTTGTRQTLVRHALELGGRQAYRRFLESRAPMEMTLAATAGVSADSLLRSWRARLIAERPLVVTTRPREAWTAVFWGTLLALLGLVSTRWRRV
ncbi:MAG: hypothetical protein HY560_03850 [Gemmatimonadetes bacterium]|nr:hypothetical protein [Gemmatimonadota bacterium]